MKAEQVRAGSIAAQGELADITIAVVNLDSGIVRGGETINYANSLVALLGTNITIVSPQVAAQGLESGAFGGVITIPADMSAKISSINATNPAPVVLSYEINEGLPKEKYIEVYRRINDAQQSLNASLSFAFVTTIFEEVHSGQAEVAKIHANDQADLEAVDELRNTSFMGSVSIVDMPLIVPDYEVYEDTGEVIAAAQGLVDLYNEAYTEVYTAAYTDAYTKAYTAAYTDAYNETYAKAYEDMCAAMQEDFDADKTNIDKKKAEIKDNIEAWFDGYMAFQGDLLDVLDAYKNELNDYRSRLTEYYDAEVSLYKKDLVGFYENAETYRSTLEQYKADLDAYKVALAGGDLSSYSGATPSPAALGLTFSSSTASLNPPPSEPLDLQEKLNAVNAVSKSKPQLSDDLEDLFAALNVLIDECDPSAVIENFDPSEYFDESNLSVSVDPSIELTVNVGIEKFDTAAAGYKDSLAGTQANNTLKLNESHTTYQNYVVALRESVTKKHTEDSASLALALEEFYLQKLASSSDTGILLADISNLLPYSQYAGAVNRQVVDFITNPVLIEKNPFYGSDLGGIRSEQIRIVVLAATGVLALLALLVAFVRRRNQNSVEHRPRTKWSK